MNALIETGSLSGFDRNAGIGASEMAKALGVSQFGTQLDLYLLKRGEAEPDAENLSMSVGKALEPIVLAEFERTSGLTVIDRQRRLPHPRLDFVWATIDGATLEPGAVVEAKTSGSRQGWGEPGSSDIPADYLIQTQTQMACLCVGYAFVPVIFGGREFALYCVEADAELQEMIETGAAEFWRNVLGFLGL